MADFPPTYDEVITSDTHEKESGSEFTEKVLYSPEVARHLPQSNTPPLETPYLAQPQRQFLHVQQPYPVTKQPDPPTQHYNQLHPPTQQPYNRQPHPPTQQPYFPSQKYSGHYSKDYVSQSPGPRSPLQTVYQQPQSAHVTMTTPQQRKADQFLCNLMVIVIIAVISMLYCFPIAICALILAIKAHREHDNDENSQKAVRYIKIAMALDIVGIILGIFGIFIAVLLGIVIAPSLTLS